MKKILRIMFVCTIALFAAVASWAEGPKCTSRQFIFAVGNPSGTYAQVVNNIQKFSDLVCDGGLKSTGGFDNLIYLMQRDADAALVQADVLEVYSGTDPMVSKNIRSLEGLYNNLTHVLVLREGKKIVTQEKGWFKQEETHVERINSFRDLNGRRVGLYGSAVITGPIIAEKLKVGIEFVEYSEYKQAVADLDSGKIDAVIAMGGKPLTWVSALTDKYDLLNFDQGDIQLLGKPYKAAKLSYKNLKVYGANVPAVRNELVVYNFTGARAKDMLELRKAIESNLENIKEDRGSHAVWQEIEPSDLRLTSWIRYTGTK